LAGSELGKRQRYGSRQFHDGVGCLGRTDAEAADDDGDNRHFCSFCAVGLAA
jgi:hypothetical protein